jgi:hypothetical protein
MLQRLKAGALATLLPLIRLRHAAPDFLIIGAQKAGTTSFYEYLARHPQLLASRESGRGWKEIHFFDREDHYRKGMGWYLRHFPSRRTSAGRLVFEGTPEYLFFERIPERIRKDLGPLPLIAMLRDPAERAYSAWRMFHSFETSEQPYLRSIHDPRSFAEAIDEELGGAEPPPGYRCFYVARGRYAEQLRRYEARFGRERLLVLDFGRFGSELPAVLNETAAFLGVEAFPPDLLAEADATRFNTGLKRDATPEEGQTIERLREYYRPHDEALWDWLGTRFGWADAPPDRT